MNARAEQGTVPFENSPRAQGNPPAIISSRRTIRGLVASGVDPADDVGRDVRGSTTILELLRMYPGGEAASLMARIQFPCAHCGGAVREPLTLAAKRHQRDARAVLVAFRALAVGGPTADELAAARARHP